MGRYFDSRDFKKYSNFKFSKENIESSLKRDIIYNPAISKGEFSVHSLRKNVLKFQSFPIDFNKPPSLVTCIALSLRVLRFFLLSSAMLSKSKEF